MNRRQYLTALAGTSTIASATALAGCTGGPGDPITMLAVNQDSTAHSVTIWVVRDQTLQVANTVEVGITDTAELGETAWKRGRYRVTVQVDDEVVLAREFESDDWFNQLDVFIASDGSIELNRGRAA